MRHDESPMLLTESDGVERRQFVRRLRRQHFGADVAIVIDSVAAGVGGVTVAEGASEGSNFKVGLGLVILAIASGLAYFADNHVRP